MFEQLTNSGCGACGEARISGVRCCFAIKHDYGKKNVYLFVVVNVLALGVIALDFDR